MVFEIKSSFSLLCRNSTKLQILQKGIIHGHFSVNSNKRKPSCYRNLYQGVRFIFLFIPHNDEFLSCIHIVKYSLPTSNEKD